MHDSKFIKVTFRGVSFIAELSKMKPGCDYRMPHNDFYELIGVNIPEVPDQMIDFLSESTLSSVFEKAVEAIR